MPRSATNEPTIEPLAATSAAEAMRHAELRWMPLEALTPYAGNGRTHSRAQLRQIADSITGTAS